MPRPDVSAQRTAEILEAAAETFARLGLGTARMDDVAAAAGVSKGTLYLYFKNKDALVAALLHGLFAPLTDALALLEGPGTASERLTRYVSATVAIFEALQPRLSLVFDAFALAPRSDAVRHLMTSHLRAYHAALVRTIEHGVSAGEFRPVDSAQIATLLMAVFDGLLQIVAVDPMLAALPQRGPAALKFVLDAIRFTADHDTARAAPGNQLPRP
jgi:AcrR family transcriptional regulator